MRNNLFTMFRICFIFAILIMSLVGTASADDMNITFKGHFGGTTESVAISGKHACIAQGQDFVVIDISDPELPSELSRSVTNDAICDICISDNYAYVADGNHGLDIINITNPEAPPNGYGTAGWVNGVAVSDGYAYIAHDISLIIFDVSNPEEPTLTGSYYTAVFPWDVAVSDGYAYVVNENGLVIIDVSNPAAPTLAGSYDTTGYAWDVTVSDNYAYVVGNNGLDVINVSNPEEPTLTGSYDSIGRVNGVTVSGTNAYIAAGINGLAIIDISNPTEPTLAGSYDTTGYAWDVTVSDNYAYVADGDNGLVILQTNANIDEIPPETVDGLVAEWHFDEGEGNILVDTSGNGNDGVINGATWIADGIFGSALEFDGEDDYVEVPDYPELSGGDGKNITITFWFNADKDKGYIITKFKDQAYKDWGAGIGINEPGLHFYCEKDNINNDIRFNGGSVQECVWHHGAFTFKAENPTGANNAELTLYLDGEKVDLTFWNDHPPYSLLPNQLYDMPDTSAAVSIGYSGSYYESDFFDGKIDEIKVFNKVLTADEIKAEFEKGGTTNENNEAILANLGDPDSNKNGAYSYDPINMATGSYFYKYQDIFIPGQGLPLTIVRSYNSMDDYNGSLGHGWTFNYNMNLIVSATDDVIIMRESGRRDKYTQNTDGTYSAPLGVFDTLTKNPDGTYILTGKDKIQYNFESDGKLTSIIDKNDNQISLTYTGDYLTEVNDASGRELILAYDAEGRIISITDPMGRVWSYSYDSQGNLIECLNPTGGQFSYVYDENNWMTSLIDPLGNQIMANTYDDEGRVTSQINALGSVYTFDYDAENKRTTETDPFGNTKAYVYDEHFWGLSETDQLGNTVTYAYDENGNRISVTNENGQTSTFAYDENGDVTGITDPLGYTTSMAYDSEDNLISLTDALGRLMSLEYSGNSDLSKIINALGYETVFAYDEYGQLISSTDANGNIATFAYNANGDQVEVVDALGNTASISYDTIGRVTSITNANGNTYTLQYDDLDRVVSVTDPLGNTETNTYDAAGNLIGRTDAAGSVTTYSYDPLYNLVEVTNAIGESVRYTYDSVGNMVAVTDAKGQNTNINYDSLNRPVSVTDPLGYTSTVEYDAVGNSISFTDAAGIVTTYSYDPLNRLIEVTDAMAGSVIYEYDAVGNMMSMTDANGHTTSYIYDALNRPFSATDPLGYTRSNAYDAVGNMIGLTDANGETTTYSYDAVDRLVQISYPDGQSVIYGYDGLGNRLTMQDGQGVTNYEYDSLNRLLSVLDPDSEQVSYTYDESGNRVKMTYPDGKAASYTYDALNRLIGVTGREGLITGYAYDANGNLINMAYPNGMSTDYVYDTNDRLARLINKNETQVVLSFEYTLDAVGNRLSVEELFSGRFESDNPFCDEAHVLTTTYKYDGLYRLTEVNYPFDKTVRYNYDPMGNRVSMITTVDGIDTTVDYSYDAADRLLSSGGVAYTYDNNGNLIEKKEKPGQVTVYTYDAANRLKGISAATNSKKSPKNLYRFEYDGDGNRLIKNEIHGKSIHSTEYVWDINSFLPQVLAESDKKDLTYYTYGLDLISITDPQRGEFYYQYDGLGSVRSLSDSKQSVKTICFYDAFGQIQKEMGHVDNEFLFTGEQMDDETGLIYLRARYYDPEIGRFISKDPFEGFISNTQSLNSYSYVLNNPVNYIDPSGNVWWYVPGVAGAVVSDAEYAYEIIFTEEEFRWSKLSGRTASGFTAPYAFIAGTATGGPIVGGVVTGSTSYVIDRGAQYISSSVIFKDEYDKFSMPEFTSAVAIGGISGPTAEKIKIPNPGRNPTHLKTLLFGKQTQKAVTNAFFENTIENGVEVSWYNLIKKLSCEGVVDSQYTCSMETVK